MLLSQNEIRAMAKMHAIDVIIIIVVHFLDPLIPIDISYLLTMKSEIVSSSVSIHLYVSRPLIHKILGGLIL